MASNTVAQRVTAARNEIGLDVYGLFEDDDTKHLLVESILIAVATSLLTEYLKGLLKPKEAGEARAKSLSGFFDRLRRKQPPDQAALDVQLAGSLDALEKAGGTADDAAAVDAFANDLAAAGVNGDTAQRLAQGIAASLKKR